MIQINGGTAGHPAFNLDPNTPVTLHDSSASVVRNWTMMAAPGTVGVLPTLSAPTGSTTEVNVPVGGFTDGLYIVSITEEFADSHTEVYYTFFGFADRDGNHLPTAGVNGWMYDPAQKAAGWFGSEQLSSNFQLDAYLRLRRKREGQFSGLRQVLTHGGTLQTVNIDVVRGATFYEANVEATATEPLKYFLPLTEVFDGAVARVKLNFESTGQLVWFLLEGGSSPLLEVQPKAPRTEILEYTYSADSSTWDLTYRTPSPETFRQVIPSESAEPFSVQADTTIHQVITVSGSTKTVNLPPARTSAMVTVVDSIGDAGNTEINVYAYSGETIGSENYKFISSNYGALTLVGVAGTGWFVV